MSTRKKLYIAIIALALTLLIVIMTMIAVFVAKKQISYSNVTIEYTSTAISADISSTLYINGSNFASIRPGSENKTLTYRCDDYRGILQWRDVLYEFVITNTADVGIDISIELEVSNLWAVGNYNQYIVYSDTPISEFSLDNPIYDSNVLEANITKNAKKYVYIVFDDVYTDNIDFQVGFDATLTLSRVTQ